MHLATSELILRLLVAAVLGAVVGIERDSAAKGAGARTHALVALGAALFTVAGAYGFGDINKFALTLNTLRQQTPTFIRSGALRREGKIAESLMTWAGGLLDVGAIAEARGAFLLAESVAERDGDAATMQGSQIGIAALDLQQPRMRVQAVNILREIVAHPVTAEMASRSLTR